MKITGPGCNLYSMILGVCWAARCVVGCHILIIATPYPVDFYRRLCSSLLIESSIIMQIFSYECESIE